MKLVSIFFILLFSINVFGAKDWEKEQIEGSIEFVKLGYGDLREKNYRSLNFVTECLETDKIIQIIPIVKNYNAFDGKKIANVLQKFRGKVSCYEFGRAGSPILHINIPYWTHQREYYHGPNPGEKISDSEVEQLINELKDVFIEQAYAEEFGVDAVMERKVYFWWD